LQQQQFEKSKNKGTLSHWYLEVLSKLMICSKIISGDASTTPTDFMMVPFSACINHAKTCKIDFSTSSWRLKIHTQNALKLKPCKISGQFLTINKKHVLPLRLWHLQKFEGLIVHQGKHRVNYSSVRHIY
jgi:hypothetical protein